MWKTLEKCGGHRLGLASQKMDGTGELVPQLSSLETPGTSLPLPAAQNIHTVNVRVMIHTRLFQCHCTMHEKHAEHFSHTHFL
jgi:hypothetical protein